MTRHDYEATLETSLSLHLDSTVSGGKSVKSEAGAGEHAAVTADALVDVADDELLML